MKEKVKRIKSFRHTAHAKHYTRNMRMETEGLDFALCLKESDSIPESREQAIKAG
jgi:hypothetical protein